VAAAQIDVVVGDLEGNVERILAVRAGRSSRVRPRGLPELTISGYPPEDLLLRPAFVAQPARRWRSSRRTGRCAAVVGYPQAGGDLHNAAAVCAQVVHGVYRKQLLPNCGVRRAALLHRLDRIRAR
jgi:NAD+ synthase (glutamine-hydrolysing)